MVFRPAPESSIVSSMTGPNHTFVHYWHPLLSFLVAVQHLLGNSLSRFNTFGLFTSPTLCGGRGLPDTS